MIRIFVTMSILLMSLSALAYPQNKATNKNTPRAKTSQFPEGMKMVQGKVSSLTATKLVIENDNGAKRDINVDAKTKFRLANKKDAKATDVTSGLLVNVTFREADNTATMVQEAGKK